jgi:hypothetical protein
MGAPDIFLRKRRDFIAIVIVSLLIYTVASVSAYDNIGSLPTPGTVGLLMGPVVTGTTQNATVIRFLADQPCIPSIRYASDILFSATGTYDHDVPGILNGTSHAIFLTGLEPAARYHYLINGCGFDGRDRTFVTLPETGSCTFIVYGDTREQAPIYTQTDRHKLVADRISQEPGIAFVINSGDLVTDSTDTAFHNDLCGCPRQP